MHFYSRLPGSSIIMGDGTSLMVGPAGLNTEDKLYADVREKIEAFVAPLLNKPGTNLYTEQPVPDVAESEAAKDADERAKRAADLIAKARGEA